MENPPAPIFVSEEYRTTAEALRIAKFERDEDDSRSQRLNAQIGRDQSLVRRPTGRMRADLGKDRAKRRVDAAWSDDALGHLRDRLEDSRGVGERRAEGRPVEILERCQEAAERVRHRCGVPTGGRGVDRHRARLTFEGERPGQCHSKRPEEREVYASRLHSIRPTEKHV